jgi:hypothetical protein
MFWNWVTWGGLGALTVIETIAIDLAARKRRAARSKRAAQVFPVSDEHVQRALEIVGATRGTCLLTRKSGHGYAWWLAQSIPGDDLLVTTGWSRSRSRIERMARVATDQRFRLSGRL